MEITSSSSEVFLFFYLVSAIVSWIPSQRILDTKVQQMQTAKGKDTPFTMKNDEVFKEALHGSFNFVPSTLICFLTSVILWQHFMHFY